MPRATTHAPKLSSAIHRIVVSTALSKMGDNFTEIALVVFVLAMTHSVPALGLVLAMTYIPKLLFGPLLTGWIDRLPKRPTLLVSDVMRAGLVISIPFIHQFWWTVIAVGLMYTFALVYLPLLRSIQPQIAGSADVIRQASTRQERYMSWGDLIAYAVAGGLIAVFGTTVAFGLDAMSYLASAMILLSLRIAPEIWQSVSRTMQTRWGSSVREALGYIRRDRLVLFVVILSGFLSLAIGSINTVLAPLSHDLWHVSTAHYAYLMVALAGGAMISAYLIENFEWSEHLSPAVLTAMGMALTGVGIGLTLIAGSWEIGLGAMVIAGGGNSFYGSSLSALVQNSTPDGIRARVLVLRTTLMGLGGAMGAWGAGVLVSQVGIVVAIIVVTGLWIALTVATLSASALRKPSSRDQVA